jgi:hypothetical protein
MDFSHLMPDLCVCPFCGNEALEVRPVMIRMWNVHCLSCRCKGPEAETPDDAILKWNSILTKAEKQRQMIVSMSNDTTKPTLCFKMWKAIRMKRMFTNLEISRLTGAKEDTVGKYTRLLAKCGYLREEGTKKDEGKTKVWRCIKTDLVQGPNWAELIAYEGDEREFRKKHKRLQSIRVQARKAG